MKILGGCLVVVCGHLGFSASPSFFFGVAIGLLIFLQGMENSIIANTTEYVRRAVTEKKTFEELEKERLAEEDRKLHEESGGE